MVTSLRRLFFCSNEKQMITLGRTIICRNRRIYVHVKSRKILEGKTALKICAPFLVFLGIIPIVYWMRQKTAEFRGEESFQYEEVTFHTTDGELYADDIKLDVIYNES